MELAFVPTADAAVAATKVTPKRSSDVEATTATALVSVERTVRSRITWRGRFFTLLPAFIFKS
jgi:hypothetical protein